MNNDEEQEEKIKRLLKELDEERKRRQESEEKAAEEKKRRLESEEKQAKAKEEAAKAKEEAAKDKEEAAKAKEEAAKDKEEAAKFKKLSDGTYYATIDQVWGIEAKFYKDFKYFAALIREKAPSFTGRDQVITPSSTGRDKVKVYSPTKTFAMDTALIAADDGTISRSSMSRNKRDNIWPKDIFGNNADGSPIAHLIPASSKDASLYFDVVIWALRLGLPVDEDLGRLEQSVNSMDWNTLQKVIHGSKPQDGNRKAHSGIKHSVCNKIRLASQFEYFDKAPCVFIIPIMDLADVKGWNGEGYNALVMCGTKDYSASAACQGIRMTKDGLIAKKEWQIEKARQLLEAVILGMAYSLLECHKTRLHHFSDDSIIWNLRKSFIEKTCAGLEINNETIGRAGRVIVPVGRKAEESNAQSVASDAHAEASDAHAEASDSVEWLKVRVVTFSSHESEVGHPAPDPLLLTVKAAINWSKLHDQPLRAAGEKPEEEDELDALAEEEYLDWRDHVLRGNAFEDLSRGLRQPDGYQGDVAVNSQA